MIQSRLLPRLSFNLINVYANWPNSFLYVYILPLRKKLPYSWNKDLPLQKKKKPKLVFDLEKGPFDSFPVNVLLIYKQYKNAMESESYELYGSYL